jgi:Leucine-rich repeat (LRR) protein
MDSNLIKNLEIACWLPRLRVLSLVNNKIHTLEPLGMCPFLVELYLSGNNIQGKQFYIFNT